jgi:endonuclease YncB( thermonuclease family)
MLHFRNPHIRTGLLFVLVSVVSMLAGVLVGFRYEHKLEAWRNWICAKGPLTVDRAVDGDTIRVHTHCGGKIMSVRLLGINTPEIQSARKRKPAECYGPEAAKYAHELVDGKVARLTFESSKGVTDDYGRLLAYVDIYGSKFSYFFGFGTSMNREMIEKGYAEEWT